MAGGIASVLQPARATTTPAISIQGFHRSSISFAPSRKNGNEGREDATNAVGFPTPPARDDAVPEVRWVGPQCTSLRSVALRGPGAKPRRENELEHRRRSRRMF